MDQVLLAAKELQHRFQEQLKEIEKQEMRARIQPAITLSHETEDELYRLVSKHHFEFKADEIHVFKNIKTSITRRGIFYNEVLQFFQRMPPGSENAVKGHIYKNLVRVESFFEQHQGSYDYHRANRTDCDELFFTRDAYDRKLCYEPNDAYNDRSFCTNRDHTLAQIMAFDDYVAFLHDPAIQQYHIPHLPSPKENSGLKWTESIRAFVELCYGLFVVNAFNQGSLTIRELARCLSQMFQVPQPDVYAIFYEIKTKTKNPLPFLNKMIKALTKLMNEEEED